ncbi:MAG TPA: hypothetical protein VEC35_07960 [Noviherbaspirillum sp.]|nr:hypothetical protein [Noviherbaspirillum sp.]
MVSTVITAGAIGLSAALAAHRIRDVRYKDARAIQNAVRLYLQVRGDEIKGLLDKAIASGSAEDIGQLAVAVDATFHGFMWGYGHGIDVSTFEIKPGSHIPRGLTEASSMPPHVRNRPVPELPHLDPDRSAGHSLELLFGDSPHSFRMRVKEQYGGRWDPMLNPHDPAAIAFMRLAAQVTPEPGGGWEIYKSA